MHGFAVSFQLRRPSHERRRLACPWQGGAKEEGLGHAEGVWRQQDETATWTETRVGAWRTSLTVPENCGRLSQRPAAVVFAGPLHVCLPPLACCPLALVCLQKPSQCMCVRRACSWSDVHIEPDKTEELIAITVGYVYGMVWLASFWLLPVPSI